MSTEFEIRNFLPRFRRLPFHRNLLMQITECFLFSCAVAAGFIGTFAVTLSATAGTLDDVRSTAWVDEGAANFRQDIYGHDAKLLAALEGKAIAW